MKQLPKTGTPGRRGNAEQQIASFYRTLFQAWGRQHWWPAQSRFEVILGAYLTQNTAWTNVELALQQLRRARLLSVEGIRRTPIAELEQIVRPAGYFRQKARSLKNFVAFLDERYGGSLDRMFAEPTEKLREELLSLIGVGPETADSILLYAGNHPVFVVDAYTRRVLERHGLVLAKAKYEEIRQLCQGALQPLAAEAQSLDANPFSSSQGDPSSARKRRSPSRMSRAKRSAEAQIYNEMHGLIVQVGKHYCLKSKALCDQCPLGRFLK
jgi:endonuclease III related protein